MGLAGPNELIYNYQCVCTPIGNGNFRADIWCEPEISIFLRNGCCDVSYIELALREIIGTMVANGDGIPAQSPWGNSTSIPSTITIDLKESYGYRKIRDNKSQKNFLKAIIDQKVDDKDAANELMHTISNYIEYYLHSH
jgi:hypothetical protein